MNDEIDIFIRWVEFWQAPCAMVEWLKEQEVSTLHELFINLKYQYYHRWIQDNVGLGIHDDLQKWDVIAPKLSKALERFKLLQEYPR